MKVMEPFLEIIGEESGKKDISYLAMIGLVIFMVVLSETALVFTTSGLFLLLSNLFYFPLIYINMKYYERGLTVNSVLGAVYFIISLFLVHFDVVDILIAH